MRKLFEAFTERFSGAQTTLVSFFTAFLLGSLALFLSENLLGSGTSWIDAMFICMSALCVTGLSSIDFSQWHVVSQAITLVIIQLGGLGIIFFTVLLGRTVIAGLSKSTKLNLLLSDVFDVEQNGVWNLIFSILRITITIEVVGFLIVWHHIAPQMGTKRGAWWALFHTVSAFNNAGFGLNQDNLAGYRDDAVVSLTIAGLIILGGIGYPVILYIEKSFLQVANFGLKKLIALLEVKVMQTGELTFTIRVSYKALDLVDAFIDQRVVRITGASSRTQMRTAIIGTVTLITLGTLLTVFGEWANADTLAPLGIDKKVLASFFQSVTTRTAGFNTISIGSLRDFTLFGYIIFMFIGACPQGTSGGIKIPTIFVLYGYLRSFFSISPRVTISGRIISKSSVAQSVRLYFLSTAFLSFVMFMVALTDFKHHFLQLIFEIVSAFGTVGLSMGITSRLTVAPKLFLILTMYTGRVGLLTFLAALRRREAANLLMQIPDDGERVQIG